MDLASIVKEVLKDKDMTDFICPGKPSRCTWHLGADPKKSPHTRQPLQQREKILPNILHAIGHTPMVRLNKIPKAYGVTCEMLVKCEFLNPGGSVKDRIGVRMLEEAERLGTVKPGDTLIEPTSGNTGIGVAMAGAVKGYKVIIVLSDKMSDEKVNTLKALGAYIVRTPAEAGFDHVDGIIAVAQRLNKAIPNSHILNQYANSGNPLAHYDQTAEEIYNQCDGKVDVVVMGAGTGGTITGIARKLKERLPNVKIVAVDPHGSILAQPETLNTSTITFYEVEGVGYDFIPVSLDRATVDSWVKASDKESLQMARRLIRDEGLLCGGSSGMVMAHAVKLAATLNKDQRCVVVLPDNIRNYLTKFVSDSWMEARGFLETEPVVNHWWWSHKVSSLNLRAAPSISAETTVQAAIETMQKEGFQQVPVIDSSGLLVGATSSALLMNSLVSGKILPSEAVGGAIISRPRKVTPDCSIGRVSKILETEPYVVVVNPSNGDEKDVVVGVITPADLLTYITSRDGRAGTSDSDVSN